jgi:hypothetical protein
MQPQDVFTLFVTAIDRHENSHEPVRRGGDATLSSSGTVADSSIDYTKTLTGEPLSQAWISSTASP